MQSATAQNNSIKVVDFYLNENDLTANMHGSTVYDQNGEKCALIKIRTNVEGFVFNAGYLGIAKTIQKVGEIWVYMPHGVKKLTISHPVLATLEYNFPVGGIEKAHTYIMELKANQVFEQIIEDNSEQGTIVFIASPKNTHITINGVPIYLDSSGKGEEKLYYGRYSYRATAENYYPLSGIVRINEENKEQTLNINLRQNYGWLKIQCPDGLEEASIFIDSTKVDNIASIPVKSGRRILRIENPLYLPVVEEIMIQDSVVTSFSTTLIPNYGKVSLTATNSKSNIYANGRFLGKGMWEGKLPAGVQTIECREEGCIPSMMQINVIKNAPTANYNLPSPTPIYGSIEIETTPQGVEVYLNGELIGTTGNQPLVKHNIQVGEKSLTLRASNFAILKDTVTVFRDSITSKQYTLEDKAFVTIQTSPENATLFINDVYVGRTPYSGIVNTGTQNITIKHNDDYATLNKKINIHSDNQTLKYSLKRDYVKKHEVYVEGIVGYNNSVHYGAALGFNLSKYFNLEVGGSGTSKIDVNNKSFSPFCSWVKAGASIPLSGRIRITPQIGLQFTNINKTGDNTKETNTFIAGCKLSYALTKHLGVSFTAEQRFFGPHVDDSNKVIDLSPELHRFQSGFNSKIGFYYFIGSKEYIP